MANDKRLVTFTHVTDQSVTRVYLCGSFTDWNKAPVPLKHADIDGQRHWQVRLPLAPGHYVYKYYLPDKNRWELDAKARCEKDGQGHENSVCVVGREPRLAVRAYQEEAPGCDHSGRRPVVGAQVEVYVGSDPKKLVGKTDGHGLFEIPLQRAGLVRIVPQRKRGHPLLCPDAPPEGVFAHAGEGACCDVTILYRPCLGEIRMSACMKRPSGQKTHLAPVTFRLYRGRTAAGKPLASRTSSERYPEVVFDDLEEGPYTLVAAPEPSLHGDHLELVGPAGGSASVHLCAGQQLNLRDLFCYRGCAARVKGQVRDECSGEGLNDVRVVLVRPDGKLEGKPVTTRGDGGFLFPDVPHGDYTLRIEEDKYSFRGVKWQHAGGAREQQIRVGGGRPLAEPEFLLQLKQDIPRILIKAVDVEDKPHPFLKVDIFDATGQQRLDTVITDERGEYIWVAPAAGVYHVAPQLTPAGRLSTLQPVSVNSDAPVRVVAPRDPAQYAPPPPPPPPLNGEVSETLADATSYPILTEEVSYRAPRPAGAPAAGAPLGQAVEGALRDVLGWRPKANDPSGFSAALTQAFTLTEVQGRTVASWTPRSYAVQTDLGAITGAQASIFTRAKAALDQSLPLLDGLYPLVETVLEEDRESIRTIVRSELTELVNEFGIEGGPRVARVDELFGLLLGGLRHDPSADPENLPAGALLRTLANRFALQRRFVNTIADEQNYSNYIILVDHFIALRRSWDDLQRSYFARGQNGNAPEPFFGTQLVLLSRSLEVVAESVQEVYFALDSVFVGPAERQVLELPFAGRQIPLSPPFEQGDGPKPEYTFPADTPNLFVAELLDWVDRVATQEGVRLVREGGKDGILAFRRITDDLRKFVRGALIKPTRAAAPAGSPKSRGGLPPGYGTPRVQRALQELADQLDETHKLAFPIRPPRFEDGSQSPSR